MRTCTVIVSHYEALPYLRATIRQIRKYQHPKIAVHTIIVDQSGDDCYEQVMKEFGGQIDVTVVRTAPLYSGYGLDWLFRNHSIETDYVAQLHSDAVPISPAWLFLPITLMEEYNLAFCGQLQFESNGTQSIYPPSPIFAMAQCFNVGRTEVYREMSMVAGFTRFHNRPHVEGGMTWANRDWDLWAAEDYQGRGSDDDVVAFHWQDKYRTDSKLGLAISGYVEPSWGRIIDGLIFHFGSHREALGVLDRMPPLYQEYARRIAEDYSDALIDEMVELAKANLPPTLHILTRNYWDGKLKESSPPSEEINKRIEELKII